MGSVDLRLASELAAVLRLGRAAETETFRGRTARAVAGAFPAVVTIALPPEQHGQAVEALWDVPSVRPLQDHSARVLRDVRDPETPTLSFLDGHRSGGDTAGVEDECPVLDEIDAIGEKHRDDCLLIDDAQRFTSAPPPHKAELWPVVEVFDAIRAKRPDHFATILADQVIAVPPSCRSIIDAYGLRAQRGQVSRWGGPKQAAFSARERLVGRR
jgi:hypothetical protein